MTDREILIQQYKEEIFNDVSIIEEGLEYEEP